MAVYLKGCKEHVGFEKGVLRTCLVYSKVLKHPTACAEI